MSNPLLELLPCAQLPAFDRIRPEHAEPAIDAVLAQNRGGFAALIQSDAAPTWENLVEPLEEMGDRLARIWAACSHLWAVSNSEDWRRAYKACLPKITEYSLELSQSEALFRAYERLAQSPGLRDAAPARRKAVKDALRDFRLSGVALPSEKKERFKRISLRLSELSTKFEEHLLDAAQAWTLNVTEEPRLAGMTQIGKAAAREKAQSKQLDGWLLTLDFPSYDAVITYADDRELRRTVYEAYATRASDQGPQAGRFDNSALMQEILALRHEEAQLLGFANFAELSLEPKMAESPADVEAFLLDLARRARPRAQQELTELRKFARGQGAAEELQHDLQPWDLAYWSEKFKQKTLGLSDDELRPYFPADRVVQGLFAQVQALYGVRFEPEAAAVWHPDVKAYAVKDETGRRFAVLYLDLYAREHKRGGAWMDECIGRRRVATGVQEPVAFLVGNFLPGSGGKPALLTHDEVLTLFHECGHGLHHVLTRVDEAAVSGIHGVAWDAVELPSQFMENWCYERDCLALFARHYQTGAPLPEDVFQRLRASRRFQAGLATLRQIEFALFDLRLHRDFNPGQGARVLETLKAVRNEVAVMQPPSFHRMPHSFSHIFAGGYAAGYYSYKWAEVLSADAFAAFEESRFAPETGHRFRDLILAQGGSREAMDLFVAFRGRKPSIEALLRHSGLEAA